MAPRKIIFYIALSLLFINLYSAKWTVLLYFDGDNNLSNNAIEDLNELEEIGSSDEVNIIVQIDNNSHSELTTCRRYYVTTDHTDNIGSQLISDLGEVDMANPFTLIDFVNWGTSNYPADKYGLVLWDHGNGWTREELPKVKYLFTDRSSGEVMSVAGGEVKYAFENFSKKMDFVIVDACAMQMMEFAGEIYSKTDYFLSSQNDVPVDGLPYDEVFEYLKNNIDSSVGQFASEICDLYINSYDENGSQGPFNGDLSFSVIDMNLFGNLLNSIEYNIEDYSRPLNTEFVETYKDSIGFNDSGRDLGLFEKYIKKYYNDFDIQVDEVVKYSITNRQNNAATGISAYFPYDYNDVLYSESDDVGYNRLEFANNASWLEFNKYLVPQDIKMLPVKINSRTGNKINFNEVCKYKACNYNADLYIGVTDAAEVSLLESHDFIYESGFYRNTGNDAWVSFDLDYFEGINDSLDYFIEINYCIEGKGKYNLKFEGVTGTNEYEDIELIKDEPVFAQDYFVIPLESLYDQIKVKFQFTSDNIFIRDINIVSAKYSYSKLSNNNCLELDQGCNADFGVFYTTDFYDNTSVKAGFKKLTDNSNWKITYLYPNPVKDSDVINIKILSEESYPVKARIFDIAGDMARQCETKYLIKGENHIGYDIKGLSSGLYILNCDINGRIENKKFAIIK